MTTDTTTTTTTTPFSLVCDGLASIDSICIGSGRFLRAVLVPALVAADYHPIIVQTRGTSFLEYTSTSSRERKQRNGPFTYEVDTVHYDGKIETTHVPYWGAGTLGSLQGKQDVLNLLSDNALRCTTSPSKPFLIGVGVTEAGLSSVSSKAMQDLYDVLKVLSQRTEWTSTASSNTSTGTGSSTKICIVNTDNVSQNGKLLQKFMNELASNDENDDDDDDDNHNESFKAFLRDTVVFHNTMVDRITSQREGSNGMVPRAEPTPLKALVIEDLNGGALPEIFSSQRLYENHGVVVRRTMGQLDADIALKLRVANGTHTAAAHSMALKGLVLTDVLSSSSSDAEHANLLLRYLDSFIANQVLPGVLATQEFAATRDETRAVYDDWRRRLSHAHFGLSTFFITQNGAAKGGIRIGPTIRDLILDDATTTTTTTTKDNDKTINPIACSTVFALAALLRFLTHTAESKTLEEKLYIGRLDPERKEAHGESKTIPYADGLSYNTFEGWYTFRCDCSIAVNGNETALPMALYNIGTKKQPVAYESVVEAYLLKSNGGNLSSVSDTKAFRILVKAVSALYARMMAGDPLFGILGSLDLEASCECLVDGE